MAFPTTAWLPLWLGLVVLYFHSTLVPRGALPPPPPPPCVNYTADHPLVQLQLQGERALTHDEVASLVRDSPDGSCTPAPGTIKVGPAYSSACVDRGVVYTVCFDASYLNNADGGARCGLFVGGARGTRKDGRIDCLGGCNELGRSCALRFHRASCFTHDVCSLVHDSEGFVLNRACGDEAWESMVFPWSCPSDERW